VEVGGVVVVEAEHFEDRAQAQDDDHHWAIVPDEETGAPTEKANARGGKYMQVYPDTGQNRNNPDAQAAGPSLDYKLEIKTTGEYTLYLRATGHDGASDSLYAQILELRSDAGGPGPNWYKQAPDPDDSDFGTRDSDTGWDARGNPDENGGGIGGGPMTFNISKAGVYTLRIQQREDGVTIDAFVLQLSSLPTPAQDIPESSAGPPPANLGVLSLAPSRDAKAAVFNSPVQIRFRDGTAKTLDQNSVVMKLDGNTVATTKTGPTDGVTTFTHQPATFFVANSTHTVSVDYKDSAGASFNETWSFTVQDYVTIPASWAVQADTSKPGFLVRTWKSPGQPNQLAWTEEQLAGLRGDNEADTSLFTDLQYGNAYFDETGTINYWNTGGQGNFTNNDTQNTPGLANDGSNDDSYSIEALTFIQLPAGLVRMGVNSDDGFRVSASPGAPVDRGGVTLGQFDGGRGVADTTFQFVVEKAGFYPFRMIFEEGGGDSAVEWFSLTPDRVRHLINDADDPAALKAYRNALGGAYVKSVTPDFFGFKVEIADNGTTVVDETSVAVTLDGSRPTPAPTVSKAAGITTVTYAGSTPWVGGSSHKIGLTFKDKSSPANSYVRELTFTGPLGFVSGSWAVGAVDTSQPGFLVRTWQSTGQPNQLAWTEEQLDGKRGANRVANPGVFTVDRYGNKYFAETGVIDYWNSGGEGNFPNSGTQNVPGLANDGTNDDNYSLEIFTFLTLPAGKLTMGVNSDDGFRTYVVPTADPRDKGVPVGQFDGGRGVANTLFELTVEKAGVYPFRTIYEEGGGDSAVEWFTVDADGTTFHLINDPNDPASIKAYRAAQVVAVTPEISLKRVGASIELTFKGVLQTSTDLKTWSDVAGAISPRSVAIEQGVARFWRARRP
jgi:hypothetical protein